MKYCTIFTARFEVLLLETTLRYDTIFAALFCRVEFTCAGSIFGVEPWSRTQRQQFSPQYWYLHIKQHGTTCLKEVVNIMWLFLIKPETCTVSCIYLKHGSPPIMHYALFVLFISLVYKHKNQPVIHTNELAAVH